MTTPFFFPIVQTESLQGPLNIDSFRTYTTQTDCINNTNRRGEKKMKASLQNNANKSAQFSSHIVQGQITDTWSSQQDCFFWSEKWRWHNKSARGVFFCTSHYDFFFFLNVLISVCILDLQQKVNESSRGHPAGTWALSASSIMQHFQNALICFMDIQMRTLIPPQDLYFTPVCS